MREIELILRPFITLVIILALGGTLWGVGQLVKWLIEVIPRAISSKIEQRKRTSHPYRDEIERVQTVLQRLRLEEQSTETCQMIEKGEEILRALLDRDQKGLAALRAADAQEIFADVLSVIQAEEEVSYVRRRN